MVSITAVYVAKTAAIESYRHDHHVSESLHSLISLPPRDFWIEMNCSWDLKDDKNT